MKLAPLRALAVAVGLCGSLAIAVPAEATNSSATWNLKGGDTFQVNAWHCGTFLRKCSWATSTKLLGNHPAKARWIENRAILQAHGFRASLSISKSPGAVLTQSSKSTGIVRWRNYKAWVADNSGVMSPNWTTTYVSTQSCGSALATYNTKVKKKVKTVTINVTEKCVYAGAA